MTSNQTKSASTAWLLWFFLGWWGGHRFYFGKKGSAIGQVCLTAGSFLTLVFGIGLLGFLAMTIWLIVDAFKINGWINEGSQPSTTSSSMGGGATATAGGVGGSASTDESTSQAA